MFITYNENNDISKSYFYNKKQVQDYYNILNKKKEILLTPHINYSFETDKYINNPNLVYIEKYIYTLYLIYVKFGINYTKITFFQSFIFILNSRKF